ncbi:MAG: hypothetical protein ABJE47_23975 [bacterium]
MKRAVIARAPTRLDFGGGWTDVPPYPAREGGAVCNVAIARYATATVATGGHVAVRATAAAPGDDALIRAALRRSGMVAAEASLVNDFPVAAGLGGSSAAGVALAGALAELQGRSLGPHARAELSRHTEAMELGVAGGFQDHYAASFGGALLITLDDHVRVEELALSLDTRSTLAERGVLIYTGESRISSTAITAVRDAYLAGERHVVHALAAMKALALDMASALKGGDVDLLGALVGEHWQHQRALHQSITTPRIDAIVSAAGQAGALGCKALGASAGGCVLAIAAKGREEELVRAVAPLGERVTYTIDMTGFDVLARLEGDESVAAGHAQ